MSKYSHGKIEGYSHGRHPLSYQHKTDPDCPLPEHGSHTQGQHNHHQDTVSRREPRPVVQINRANDAKVGGHGWSSH